MSDDDPAGADLTSPRAPSFVARLAPFVAWLATGSLDESTRRTHRQVIEAFLNWCHADPGPCAGVAAVTSSTSPRPRPIGPNGCGPGSTAGTSTAPSSRGLGLSKRDEHLMLLVPLTVEPGIPPVLHPFGVTVDSGV
ncbi:hypothetical protein [Pseudonocardia alni]|uniref:Uncharacterized protein n=1 Tax=Pseudonocardia alni TaxID=33907 RepID=A0A852VXL1_PSEA5|nr:hypothetical protein [Pseudonocardia antarctica]NYG00879.1 hypothetical protein [Pseudonocardia antarctica]